VQDQWAKLGDYASQANSHVLAVAKKAYESFNSSQTLSKIRSALSKVNQRLIVERIAPLETLDQLQHAPVCMIRYLMANPTLRSLYAKQLVDGYSGSYINDDAGTLGPSHYDWRRVVEGVFMHEDGRDVRRYFFEDLKPGDEELSFVDKTAILYSWSATDALLAAGQGDPSSPLGESL
jgi:hypothetical protein